MARSRRDDDDDEDEKPRKKTRRPVEEDDEDDEEEVKPKAKKKPAKPIDDDDDDEEDEAPPPRKKPVVKAAPQKVFDDDEEDEEEDDTPRKKKKPVAKDDDDEDEDEDDDTPKKRKKGKKKGGLPKPLLIGGAIAALVMFCGCGGFSGYYFFLSDSPKAAFEDYIAAVEKDDAGRMWDRMDKATQNEIEQRLELMTKVGPDKDKFKDKKGRDLYIAMVSDATAKRPKYFDKGESPVVESYTSEGSSGSVSIKTANGTKMTIPCVKEDGRWRLQFSKFKPSRP